MRAVVILLLIANLALFAMLFRDLQAPQAQKQTADNGTLRAVPHDTSLFGECLVSEAFAREVEAQLAMFRLDIPHSLVMRHQDRTDGWRVHLPPTDSLESARRQLRQLREAGVDRPSLVTDGEMSNTVSIGLRAEQADAEELGQRIQAMGFDVRVTPRQRREPGYHLVLQANEPPKHLVHFGWTTEPCRDALR